MANERSSLAPDDIAELFGRLPDDAEARDTLAKEFLPLAEHLARRFGGRGEALDDLVQVASLGLLHAIDRFDPGRDVRFTTYATATIIGEIKRHFRDRGWALRMPRSLQESAIVVNRTVTELWQEQGRSPTAKEVGERTGLSEDQVLEAMDAAQAYSTSSLDAPIGDDEAQTTGESLGSADDGFELAEGWIAIKPALDQLPERERRILYLRFFRGLTQTEIAEQLDISQMHVSRLLAKTLAQLRRDLKR